MTRYYIIAAAVLTGVAIGWYLFREKKEAKDAVIVVDKKRWWLLPWLTGLAILMGGLFLLADDERASKESKYQPARLENGHLESGSFSEPYGNE